jgi:hypothetical protein
MMSRCGEHVSYSFIAILYTLRFAPDPRLLRIKMSLHCIVAFPHDKVYVANVNGRVY